MSRDSHDSPNTATDLKQLVIAADCVESVSQTNDWNSKSHNNIRQGNGDYSHRKQSVQPVEPRYPNSYPSRYSVPISAVPQNMLDWPTLPSLSSPPSLSSSFTLSRSSSLSSLSPSFTSPRPLSLLPGSLCTSSIHKYSPVYTPKYNFGNPNAKDDLHERIMPGHDWVASKSEEPSEKQAFLRRLSRVDQCSIPGTNILAGSGDQFTRTFNILHSSSKFKPKAIGDLATRLTRRFNHNPGYIEAEASSLKPEVEGCEPEPGYMESDNDDSVLLSSEEQVRAILGAEYARLTQPLIAILSSCSSYSRVIRGISSSTRNTSADASSPSENSGRPSSPSGTSNSASSTNTPFSRIGSQKRKSSETSGDGPNENGANDGDGDDNRPLKRVRKDGPGRYDCPILRGAISANESLETPRACEGAPSGLQLRHLK